MISEIPKQRKGRLEGGLSKTAAFSLSLLLMVCGLAWAIPICGSCGYENGEAARFCSHCGNNLNTAAVKPVEGGADSEEGQDEAPVSSALISPDAVAEDMRTARKFLKGSEVDLANLFARNALALNLLAGVTDNELRANAIVSFIDKCSLLEGRVQRRCSVCRGTGKAVMTSGSLSGSKRELRASSGRCSRCSGSGYVRGTETVDERKYRIGQALERYRTLQQNAGRVPVGLAWVPSASASELGLSEIVALKRAIPPACDRCAGVGRSDCTTCRGGGKTECRAKGCERGDVEIKNTSSGTLGGSGSGLSSKMKVKCQACSGSGFESCKKCSGAGSHICKECNGSGSGAICVKCSGSGILPCRRCLGSLIYRGKPCQACATNGRVECSSCVGTGRKR
jgi:hypothetical protein